MHGKKRNHYAREQPIQTDRETLETHVSGDNAALSRNIMWLAGACLLCSSWKICASHLEDQLASVKRDPPALISL
jgi:hypothetical protein